MNIDAYAIQRKLSTVLRAYLNYLFITILLFKENYENKEKWLFIQLSLRNYYVTFIRQSIYHILFLSRHYSLKGILCGISGHFSDLFFVYSFTQILFIWAFVCQEKKLNQFCISSNQVNILQRFFKSNQL